VLNTGIIL